MIKRIIFLCFVFVFFLMCKNSYAVNQCGCAGDYYAGSYAVYPECAKSQFYFSFSGTWSSGLGLWNCSLINYGSCANPSGHEIYTSVSASRPSGWGECPLVMVCNNGNTCTGSPSAPECGGSAYEFCTPHCCYHDEQTSSFTLNHYSFPNGWDPGGECERCPIGEYPFNDPYLNCLCREKNYDCENIICPITAICNTETGNCDTVDCHYAETHKVWNPVVQVCDCPTGFLYDGTQQICKGPKGEIPQSYIRGMKSVQKTGIDGVIHFKGGGGYEKHVVE